MESIMHSRIMSRPAGGAGMGFLVAFLLLAGVPGGAVAQVDDPVVINEVLADPASDWDGDGEVDFKGDEWIEILNNGDQPVDLASYYLKDDTGDELHLRLSGVLQPAEIRVFYGSEAVAWQQAMGQTTTGFSLNNGGDFVKLMRQYQGPEGPEYELMFSISYADHEAEDDRSCGFNTEMSDWILFDSLNPYGGEQDPVGTGCAPSPGAPNICSDQVGLEGRTFGGVKAIFR
jgi:hypothetical protein